MAVLRLTLVGFAFLLPLVSCQANANDDGISEWETPPDAGDFLLGTFPVGFQWGTATSAYQIEGAWNIDGRGVSIWDTFCHGGGFVRGDATGDVACDSYHKYPEDIAILKNLGVHFYRFSLSWSRILPDGTLSFINEPGIDYYNRLIDGLLAEGIQPMVTLYHWDLPQTLEDNGGWLNPAIVNYFNDYARLCYQRFGDRVKLWVTLNEPWVVAWTGYGSGNNAPGVRLPGIGEYQSGHNLLKSHAEAWHTYNTEFRQTQNGRISITLNCDWKEPYTNSTEDIAAGERAMEFMLGWFANPVFVNGDYPEVMKEYIGRKSQEEGRNSSRLPEFTEAEKARIVGTHDFFGFNHYTTALVENFEDGIAGPSWDSDQDIRTHVDRSWPTSGKTGFLEVPWGFRKVLNWIKDHYNNPEVMITENGVSDDRDYVYGSLDDQQRIRFLTNYTNNVLKAINLDGCYITAYALWTLMDNFEWQSGFESTFGVYQVNFSDPELLRVPKASVSFYQQLIVDNGWPVTPGSTQDEHV